MSQHGDIWRNDAGTIELRCGPWQEVLADVGQVDAVVADPPYGARTHRGHNSAEKQLRSATGQSTRTAIGYAAFGDRDVFDLVADWAHRCRGWQALFTSHDLIPVYEGAYAAAGRYSFAPVGVRQFNPRLLGDGPTCELVYLMVARPRTVEFARWRSLPGFYPGPPGSEVAREGGHIGGKSLAVTRAIVRDYSRPGDLVCDPCAGTGTTLLAAATEGRRAIGAELDPETFDKAVARLSRGYTPALFAAHRLGTLEQGDLFAAGAAE